MPWSVLAAVVGAGGALGAADKNAKAAKKAAGAGTTTTQEPWSAQQPYLKELFAEAQRLYGAGEFGRTAGFTRDDMMGREGMRGAAGRIDQLTGKATGAWEGALNAPDLKNNPYIQDYINASLNPIQKRLQEDILPGIRGDALSSGMYGGSRQGVGEGNAVAGFAREAGDTTAKINMSAY